MSADEKDRGLHRMVYADVDGKMVETPSSRLSVWAAVDTTTGMVDCIDLHGFDDDLTELCEGWEWREFVLCQPAAETKENAENLSLPEGELKESGDSFNGDGWNEAYMLGRRDGRLECQSEVVRLREVLRQVIECRDDYAENHAARIAERALAEGGGDDE